MDILTLDRLVRELRPVLQGARVRDVRAHAAGVVRLDLGARGVLLLAVRREWRGLASGEACSGTGSEDAPTRQFADRLRPAVSGARLGEPNLLDRDRVLSIPVQGRGELLLEIAAPALLWIEGDARTIASRLILGRGPARLSPGVSYTAPAGRPSPLDAAPEAIAEAVRDGRLAQVAGGNLIARELAHRVAESATADGTSERADLARRRDDPGSLRLPLDPGRAAACFSLLRDEASVLGAPAAVYTAAPGAFTPIAWRATHLGEPAETCATLAEASLRSLERTLESSPLDAARRSALAASLRRGKKLARRLDAVRADLEKARGHAMLRRWAEALLAYAATVPPRASSIELPDPGDPSKTLEIPLEPKESAPQNAERLFRLARRLERSVPRQEKRMREIGEALASLETRRREIEEGRIPLPEAATPRARERAKKTKPARRSGREEPSFHPRRYVTSEGWTVLVGRNDTENDWLTHRHARPDDIWLHAHGAPGSHAVLRREGRNQNPSKQTLLEAAAIAAYYSKARTSTRAPVIYTLRKYVRKPRGGEPGLAVCSHEKMVMVKPALPAEAPRDEDAEE